MDENENYTKEISNFIYKMIPRESIIFTEILFKKKLTEDRLPVEELEMYEIFDPNLYLKEQLMQR
jgi:hypothetical protein